MHLLYQLLLGHSQAFHQPAELLRIHPLHLVGAARPLELTILQSLVQKQESIAFPKQTPDSVGSPPTKQEQRPFLKRIQVEPTLYDGSKAIDPQTEIRVTARHIYVLILVCVQIVQHVSITSSAVFKRYGSI